MCRLASKAASQRLWLAKRENLNYHRGASAVARVREWQAAHPEYRERQRAKRLLALQDLCAAQVLDFEAKYAAIKSARPSLFTILKMLGSIAKFTEFPEVIAANKDVLADKTVVTFCTGGIRCEKAVIHMQNIDYDSVYQLEGGILKSFEDVGGAHYMS